MTQSEPLPIPQLMTQPHPTVDTTADDDTSSDAGADASAATTADTTADADALSNAGADVSATTTEDTTVTVSDITLIEPRHIMREKVLVHKFVDYYKDRLPDFSHRPDIDQKMV